ncbi:conserved hypothetical protein [Burkholderiales bacterium 8X]|nr:conserved hypothetical protein [Burkholderiales bacterium 8X]
MTDSAQLTDRVQRIMQQVDYYLHCELDAEYVHDQPMDARERLELALKEELARNMALETH